MVDAEFGTRGSSQVQGPGPCREERGREDLLTRRRPIDLEPKRATVGYMQTDVSGQDESERRRTLGSMKGANTGSCPAGQPTWQTISQQGPLLSLLLLLSRSRAGGWMSQDGKCRDANSSRCVQWLRLGPSAPSVVTLQLKMDNGRERDRRLTTEMAAEESERQQSSGAGLSSEDRNGASGARLSEKCGSLRRKRQAPSLQVKLTHPIRQWGRRKRRENRRRRKGSNLLAMARNYYARTLTLGTTAASKKLYGQDFLGPLDPG
jgi:hypothetical protein